MGARMGVWLDGELRTAEAALHDGGAGGADGATSPPLPPLVLRDGDSSGCSRAFTNVLDCTSLFSCSSAFFLDPISASNGDADVRTGVCSVCDVRRVRATRDGVEGVVFGGEVGGPTSATDVGPDGGAGDAGGADGGADGGAEAPTATAAANGFVLFTTSSLPTPPLPTSTFGTTRWVGRWAECWVGRWASLAWIRCCLLRTIRGDRPGLFRDPRRARTASFSAS